MSYKLIKNEEIIKKEKFGVSLGIYPDIDNCGIVLESTEEGHNQEFYNNKSTFIYIILEGNGSFFLDGKEVVVSQGDMLSISPNTKIYFKGKLKMILITSPKWNQVNEVETKDKVW